MEVRDDSANCFVRLTPISYQFQKRNGDPYDDNWLIIKGRVQDVNRAWTFQDPALLVGEAQSISAWLREVAAGRGVPMQANDDGELWPTLQMIEPNIGLGLVECTPTSATLRFFLWLESAPPSTVKQGEVDMEYFLDLTTELANLEAAAAEWDSQLAQFPHRS
ncbi:MAG: hypothetical protein QM598_03155 [Protaetiibacter sp.]